MNKNKVKLIAMYLPQFHIIPENDQWWGNGFTEWTNTRKAEPLFKGHIQPKTPQGEKYYDLLNPEVIREQARQAKQYGIDGFSFYHYWFKDGKKLLYRPAEILLENTDIDLKFCFTWANENWTRTWHNGGNGQREILVEEEYGVKEDWDLHFMYVLPFFKDTRYIKVDNKPVFIIYNISHMVKRAPDMLSRWNDLARKNGFDGVYWIATVFDELPFTISDKIF